MTRSARQLTLATLFSLIMIISVMGPFVGGALAATGGTTQPTTSAAVQGQGLGATHDVETVNITDELAVWERAALRPAVVDRSNAVTAVNSQTVFLEAIGETASIETSQEGVFQQGAQVDFELAFQNGADTTKFSGQEFKVLVTRIDAERDTTEVFLDAQNVTVAEVERALEDVDGYDAFEQEVQNQNEVRFGTVRDFFDGTEEFEQFADSFEANQTLTTERFEQALTSEEFLNLTEFSTASGGNIDTNGNATASINLDEAGTYLLIGHVGGEVYDSGDDRPFFNGTTALSVDAVTAQESSSTIDVATTDGEIEAGNNVSVDATANLDADENVSHAVVVMDEGTFSQSNSRIIIEEDFSRDLRTGDVTVNSSIAEIQGVANVEPNVRISGTNIGSDNFSGTVSTEDQANSFFDIRNAIVDGFDIRDQAGDAATFNAVGDTTLNASMTAIGNVSGDETIEVETLDAWETGEYTVLHIAADQQDGNISTNRETIDIVDTIDTSPDPPVNPSDPDDDDDDDDDDADDDDDVDDGVPPEVVEPAPEDLDIIERDGGAAVTVRNIRANTSTRFGVGRNVTRNGATVRNFTVNLRQDRDEFTVNVSTSDDPPETTPPVETGTPFTYVDVDAGNLTDNDYNSVEWNFTVDLDRLEENDVEPENVQLQRYNGTQGSWERFETTHSGNGEFVAEVPGFSTFAITAVEPASLSVTDASLSVNEVEVDEAFDVAATVENAGDERGEIELEVLVDGDVVETRTVTLDGNETAEETFEVSVADTGDFEVTVNAVSAGDISVTSVDTGGGDDTGDATGDDTGGDDTGGDDTGGDDTGGDGTGDDGGNLGIALVVLLFALLVAGGFIYYLNAQE